MAVDLLLGLQWGDEGKGKIVDVLSKSYNIVARFQGGPNAGHTLEFDRFKYVLHTIPSGIFHKGTTNIIGNGVVIDPVIFQAEVEAIIKDYPDALSRLAISRKAHLILPTHRLLDQASEYAKGKAKIGSTLKGISPAYMDKTGRNALRIGDLENPNWKNKYRNLVDKHQDIIVSYYKTEISSQLKALEKSFFKSVEYLNKIKFIDSEVDLHNALKNNKSILAEGAQGCLLDIDFGTYPFVTSSNTISAGACTGLGVSPKSINNILGIFKSYTTRVGAGPFPTELFDQTGEYLGKKGNEFGATTGRKRRCGWLDLVALNYAVQINGVTELIMMKSDVLSGLKNIKVCTAYNYLGQTVKHFPYSIESDKITPIYTDFKGWDKDLTNITCSSGFPEELNIYIKFLEDYLKVPITIVSVALIENKPYTDKW